MPLLALLLDGIFFAYIVALFGSVKGLFFLGSTLIISVSYGFIISSKCKEKDFVEGFLEALCFMLFVLPLIGLACFGFYHLVISGNFSSLISVTIDIVIAIFEFYLGSFAILKLILLILVSFVLAAASEEYDILNPKDVFMYFWAIIAIIAAFYTLYEFVIWIGNLPHAGSNIR